MRLKEAWQTKGWVKLAAAVIINAVFLAFMLTCFAPVYETNDDLFLSKFVDGQLSHRTIWMPYVNIVLACLIKVLYGAFGTGFPWYSFCEYLVMFCGFTAITWVLLRRFRPAPALVMTAVLLGAFGTDCYLSLNFSKPGAIGTASGMFLMLYAMRNETGRVMKLSLWLGFALALCGLAWRYESFGVCALMMTGGLDIHEWPNANPSGEAPMPAGAVCSAEPGIYIPGRFGVRIEDVMVIREGGAEIITKAPKELVVL